jgi:methylmalonyl-CoA/ethylmalonyl-CoA epimerase
VGRRLANLQSPPPELVRDPFVVTTIGTAVADLRAAMRACIETLGWGPWNVYRQEPPALTDMVYRGEPAEFSFLVAGTRAPGGFAYWLCQPLEGPSIYRDLVEEGRPGPHFLTVWRRSEADAAAVRRLADRGATELMAARLDGSIEFSFLDARDVCGMIVETGSGDSADQPLESTYP